MAILRPTRRHQTTASCRSVQVFRSTRSSHVIHVVKSDNRTLNEIGDSHLFVPFLRLGFLFLGPTDWQQAQWATERVLGISRTSSEWCRRNSWIAGERVAGLRVLVWRG